MPKFEQSGQFLKTIDGEKPTAPVQENQYDGRAYLIVTKSYSGGTLSEARHAYFTDQWQCIEERLGTSTTPDRQFVWGVRYIDDLILRDRSVSGSTLNERLYALQDANWNVTTVANSTGTIQERYEYDPYGATTLLAPDFTVRATSNFAWETTYCSYRWDQSTCLFAIRNRFYHPRLGIWLTRDPLEYVDGLNHYSYLAESPLLSTDPEGLRIFTIEIKYWFSDTTVVGNLEAIKKEVERIFQACFTSNCKADTVAFVWTKLLDDKEYDKEKEDFGFSGGNLFGFNPTKVTVGMKDTLTAPTFGQTGNFSGNMNVPRLIDKGAERGYKPVELIGMTIAHELGLHGIGEVSGHYKDKDCIDAAAGKPSTTFSKELCDKLMDHLDLS